MQETNPFIRIGMRKGREEGLQEGMQQGMQRGVQQGLHDGEAGIVVRLLRRRFGILPAGQEDSVRALPSAQLEELAEALLDFRSSADLASWLESRR